jgi:phytoene desaturase
VLNAYAEPEKFIKEAAEKLEENPDKLRRFLKKNEKIYQITKHVFLEKSLHKLSTYLNFQTFKSFLQSYELDIFRTMHQSNQAAFSNPKTVQLFDRYATYNGSNPYLAPATLNVISHLEHNMGAYFPKKGMYAITKALVSLAYEIGIVFRYNTFVNQILVKNNHAIGIKTNDTEEYYDVIVSNMDINNTYKNLLNTEKKLNFSQKIYLNQPKSTSALIFYWGIKQTFPKLELHNIFFSDNYAAEFEALKNHTIYQDPTVYVFISSKIVKTDAPPNCENWFVMINVPHNSGQDWDRLIQTAKQNILQKLSTLLKQNIENLILTENILDPRSIEANTYSVGGALYGNSSNNKFAAFLRHSNFSSSIKNLYFCGGSVHPGGGIPLCLLSAKITADLI